jgi:hypothetical protein
MGWWAKKVSTSQKQIVETKQKYNKSKTSFEQSEQ